MLLEEIIENTKSEISMKFKNNDAPKGCHFLILSIKIGKIRYSQSMTLPVFILSKKSTDEVHEKCTEFRNLFANKILKIVQKQSA